MAFSLLRSMLVFIVLIKAIMAIEFDYDSDESCTAAIQKELSIEGTEAVVEAMRKGWWTCAEALASSTEAPDLHSVVALESRTITSRIGSLKSAIESMRKPSQMIIPAFQWAQSPDSIFINVKFSHKLDAPATLDVVVDDVSLSATGLKLQGSKDKKLFSLSINFYADIDPDQSSWTTGSVGRIIFTLKKQGDESKWPKLLPKGISKPPQMHLWWDKQEEFRSELEKYDDEDDDEEDIAHKKKEKEKEDLRKEKEMKLKLKKKNEKKEMKKKSVEEKRARKKKQLEMEAERDRNLPDYVIETIKSMELKLKNELIEMEEELNKKKETIENDCELKKTEIEHDMKREMDTLETEIETKISALRYEQNYKVWSDSVQQIKQSVNHEILTLQSPGQWEAKVTSHIPIIERIANDKVSKVELNQLKVHLTHGISEDHFIGSIWLVDSTSNDILGFKSLKDNESPQPPQAEFSISASVKHVTAFAHCNLHGVWSSEPFQVDSQSENDEL